MNGSENPQDPGGPPPPPDPTNQQTDASAPELREFEFLAERTAPLTRKGVAGAIVPPTGAAMPEPGTHPGSGQPGDDAGRPVEPAFRTRLIEEYRNRQRSQQVDTTPAMAPGDLPQAPEPPPTNNWIPIGPSVLRQGQGGVKPATSGRVPAIAVAPGGNRVYVGSANGGVWRSDDAGQSWRSMMDAFDLNPTTAASDSLSCGAIAVDLANPDRVYVGSGEGDGGAYFGVGPIVSSDGGTNWSTENVAPGDASLAGTAFYALAVDPANPDRVVAGTRQGLYRREPAPGGGFHWARKALGGINQWTPAVVAANSAGVTTFYAAQWFGPVYSSTDGQTWAAVGTGFPTANVGRIALALRATDPGVVYALITRADDNHLLGVYRLATSDGTWRQVSGIPATLFGPDLTRRGQGTYDTAIAIDPGNANRVYVGGSTALSNGDWSGSLYRCDVTVAATTVSAVATFIGGSVHGDIHTLVFAPGDPNALWLGCDGGVFRSTNPTGTGDIFTARNTGLATLTMNYLAQHPTEDAVLFCGTQDNGGVRFTGEEAWLYSSGGDGGFHVVNWNDPYRVLSTYVFGSVRRSTNGGQRYAYANVNVPLFVDAVTPANSERALFYAPIAGTPVNAAAPAEAEIVAFGSIRPWISTDFGSTWQSIPNNTLAGDQLNERIRSLTFASATKLYAATMTGDVYRLTRSGATWTRTQIDTLGGANALPLSGPITDIAVDLADATGNSIFVTFGGIGDFRHVWHFNGTQWQARSGPAAGNPNSLLDVQATTIVVDSANTGHLYVGADIGVWRSTDGGQNWTTFSSGLPDAGVLDLLVHPGRRLLRAATHGRSVYERTLPDTPKQGVELYVRSTQLDQGRSPAANFLPDPTAPGETVRIWRSPDIKLDTPDAGGNYQFPPTGPIDFLQFVDTLTDDANNVATSASATITTRVYVQVHNRGVIPAGNVRVMLLLANASAGLPALPVGYDVNVRTGTPIMTGNWRTIGFATLDDIRVGAPKIAAFNLTSNLLPPPANLAGNQHHCVVALVHHADDQFTSTETNTDAVSGNDRKVAHKNLTVVQFTGTVPPEFPLVVPFRLNSPDPERRVLNDLRLDLGGYQGRVRLVIPELQLDGDPAKLLAGLGRKADRRPFDAWAEAHISKIRRTQRSRNRYDLAWSRERLADIASVRQGGMALTAEQTIARISRIVIEPGAHHTLFLVIDRARRAKIGESTVFEITQLDTERDEPTGGLTVRVEVVPEPAPRTRGRASSGGRRARPAGGR